MTHTSSGAALRRLAFALLPLAPLLACERTQTADAGSVDTAGTVSARTGTPVYVADVVRRWPHDPEAFTQGLEVVGESLYESTGLEGRSYVRRSDLATGAELRRADLDKEFFGEGITVIGDRLYQLTWKSQTGFIYDAGTLERRGTFSYTGEGWGLTHDSTSLIMSDGTSTLRWLDPTTFQVTRTVTVTDNGRAVGRLNELEWVKGEIFANVWQSDQIARIDPASGRVVGWIDLAGLLSASERRGGSDENGEPVDVLNGVAYDAAGDRLFVTGKLWPTLFQITLRRR